MPDPIFGVVLLNWNGHPDTTAALESLLDAAPQPRYVVVVDNASTDNSIAALRTWSEHTGVKWTLCQMHETDAATASDTWLRIIVSDSNRGYAGGNNVGLEHLAHETDATHFLLLNNDALIAPDYFARMAEALQRAPDTGLMGCAIYHHPETDRIWFAGGYEDRFRGISLHESVLPAGDAPVSTEWITGCAMLIARQLYDGIGGLAECFFPIYCEDADYSFRARAAGAAVRLAPAAKVYHKVGGTVGLSDVVPRVAYWQNRHRVFYVRRNYVGRDRIVALTYLSVAKPIRALLHVARGRGAMAAAICRGVYHGFRDTPA